MSWRSTDPRPGNGSVGSPSSNRLELLLAFSEIVDEAVEGGDELSITTNWGLGFLGDGVVSGGWDSISSVETPLEHRELDVLEHVSNCTNFIRRRISKMKF